MRVDLVLESEIARTPRVVQTEGIFDVPAAEKSRVEYHLDVPLDEQPWSVGLIVGPSGAGKSSVARHLFGDALIDGYEWPNGKAIVDGFGALPIRDTTAALNSVGFSSPPNWVRPFSVLSNGERFRANLARAIVDERPLVAVDEFTSVVDRQSALVASHSLAKAVRAKPGKRFVAVTCHYDVLDWLQPDWVLEPHIGKFDWRSVQPRPRVTLDLVRCDHSAWRWFAPHHYLSADLNKSARCFVGLVDGSPAAFVALRHFVHPRVSNIQQVTRVVVMPEFQGLGLGRHMLAFAGAMATTAGHRCAITTSHPALIASLARSVDWRMTSRPRFANAPSKKANHSIAAARAQRRRCGSFEWSGGKHADETGARNLWHGKVADR